MNWKESSVLLAIALIALLGSGCGVGRKASSTTAFERVGAEVRDTVVREAMVEVRDTVKEVTTVTVQLGAAGDTTFTSVVTERERVRDRVAAAEVREKVVIRTDTVYVARRDSVVAVVVGPGARVGADGAISVGHGRFVAGLRWAVFLVVATTVLILVLRFGRKGIL